MEKKNSILSTRYPLEIIYKLPLHVTVKEKVESRKSDISDDGDGQLGDVEVSVVPILFLGSVE